MVSSIVHFSDLIQGLYFKIYVKIVIRYVPGCRGKEAEADGLKGLDFFGVGGFCSSP